MRSWSVRAFANLSLNHCMYITDKSMEYLFMNKNPMDGVNSYGKCKKLETLNIRDSRISKHGVETILRSAPKIQDLYHREVPLVLRRMHGNDLEAPLVQCSLTTLRVEYRAEDLYSNESFARPLSIATRVCPNVTNVILDVQGNRVEKAVIRPLRQLKNLKNLYVKCYGWYFTEDLFSKIVPVLCLPGQSITRLYLEGLLRVDVGIIGVCCPLLEELGLSSCDESDVVESREEMFIPPATNTRPFTFLRLLAVSMRDSNLEETLVYFDFTPSQWKDILSSRHLESLTIRKSSSLNDGLLSEVIKNGQEFPKLKKLDLFECPNITAGFVQTFLELPNPLEEIKVEICDRITKSDFDSLKSFCKVNGFDVDIKCKEWIMDPLFQDTLLSLMELTDEL